MKADGRKAEGGDGRLGRPRGASRPLRRNRPVPILLGLAALSCLAVIAAPALRPARPVIAHAGTPGNPEATLAAEAREAAFWGNIGGCGSSGGGAAAGAGKWMGRGVRGGLVDLEILGNKTLGGDYLYTTVGTAATFHYPAWPAWSLGLSLGWKAATLEHEGFKAGNDAIPAQVRQTGGLGDLGLTVGRLFGEANEQSLSVSASLPTGQHDIKRLHQKAGATGNLYDDRRWISPFAQPGSGLYSLGATYEYTRDRDWGLFVFGGSYTAAFARDNWDCRAGAGTVDEKVVDCQEARPSPLTWRLWELRHQGWYADHASWTDSPGAPGTGATGGDVVSAWAYVGHREEASTQSLGLTLNVPLTPTYYWESGPFGGDSRVSTRIRTNDYLLKLSAGIEVTHPAFPVFLSVGIPWRLTDMVDRGRLTEPVNYIGTLGVKGTFF